MAIKKLVLFDLDGVILDSKHNMNIAWNATCNKHNINISFDDYFANIGRPFKDILTILKIVANQDNIHKTFHDASAILIDKSVFFKQAKQTLQNLVDNNIKIGIVTSKDEDRTHKILQLLQIKFNIVQTPNNKLRGKPAPDHLLYAMAKQNIAPKYTIYVGDMAVDYQAAQKAGIDYAHALWGYGQCDGENIVKLSKFSQLLNII